MLTDRTQTWEPMLTLGAILVEIAFSICVTISTRTSRLEAHRNWDGSPSNSMRLVASTRKRRTAQSVHYVLVYAV